MNKNKKSIHELVAEYEASSGYRLFSFLLNASYLQYVLESNYKELLSHITKYEKATTTRQKNTAFRGVVLSKIKSRNYLKKFIKYLHNYAASVYSMEEHYKDFLDWGKYDPRAWKKFSKISSNPLHLLVFALRNHLTHHGVPSISISVRYSRDDITGSGLFITTKGLFKISRLAILSALRNVKTGSHYPSKFISDEKQRKDLYAYLSREYSGTFIDLKEIVTKHYEAFWHHVTNFNQRMIKKYESEYRATERLHRNIVKVQTKLLKSKFINSTTPRQKK